MAPRIDGRVGSKKERKQIFYLMRRKIWKVKENGVGAADDDGPTDQRMSQRRLLHGGQKRTRNGTASGAKKRRERSDFQFFRDIISHWCSLFYERVSMAHTINLTRMNKIHLKHWLCNT